MTAKTYTIATANDMMIAIVPDGQDIAAEVERTAAEAGVTFDQFDTMTGLTLTDEPTADDQIVVYGDKMGRVTDEDGIGYLYAVKRRDDAAEQLQRMRRSDAELDTYFNPFAVAQARSRERVAAHKAEKAAAFAADLAAAAEKGPDYYAAFRAEAIAIISAHREVPGSASDADLVDLIRSI